MRRAFLSAGLFAIALAGAAKAQPLVTGQQPNRAALEQQLRVRMAEVMQKRLGLNDAQMTQLQAVNARYAPQMGALALQERQTRQQLRMQMTAATPDQARAGQLLDTLIQLQKQRIGLVESEQKDLAAFLTPVQRGRYMALQAQLKRRADQLRRQVGGPGAQMRRGGAGAAIRR